jgi:O-antigen ligase
VVSILEFSAPRLVWPRYIVEHPNWVGRAVGVPNQPVVNGLILIVGFLAAVLLVSTGTEPRRLRVCAAVVAAASLVGIYLTHTRVVWLAFGLVVAAAIVAAKGFRTGFVLVGTATVGLVLMNWSRFASSDRSAGGVGSEHEILDRLNTFTTSIWAFEQEPLVGWGIGRFTAVNTYHHQQFSPGVPWFNGYGIPSHLDGLGVLVELGLIGLVLWLAVLVLLYRQLVSAVRRLSGAGLTGRPFGITALLCLVAQTTTGLTVDLRFFDFPNMMVMLLAGAAIGVARQRAARVDPGEPAGSQAVVPVAVGAGSRGPA